MDGVVENSRWASTGSYKSSMVTDSGSPSMEKETLSSSSTAQQTSSSCCTQYAHRAVHGSWRGRRLLCGDQYGRLLTLVSGQLAVSVESSINLDLV